jgi:acyl-CoA thioester hydrolase
VPDDKTEQRRRPPRPADFPHHVVHTIRFRDLDPQNHVNHAVFVTFLEAGRVALLRDPRYGMWVPGATYVQASLTVDYLAELHWPGDVLIGTGVARLGTSSLTFTQGLFTGERCAALCRSTLVLVDAETRKPRPFPDELAARLRAGGGRVTEVG